MTGEQIWREYHKGLEYLTGQGFYRRVESCHDFVNGDQWKGLRYSGERPPRLNILFPMMKSSTSMVGQNALKIEYTSLDYGPGRGRTEEICSLLTQNAARLWEQMKMDRVMWEVLQDAYIAGDSFLYFYDDPGSPRGKIICEKLDTVNIMLGDESEPDIQKQPYILIVQRVSLRAARHMAEARGQRDTDRIVPDAPDGLDPAAEKRGEKSDKLTLVARLWKEKGKVWVMKVSRTGVIQPRTRAGGMKLYPIAKYSWKPRKGLARGDGDVWDKIPNQISINKSLYRLEQAVRSSAYPIKVYRQNAISPSSVAKLGNPGRSIALGGSPDMPIANVVSYLSPGAISPYANSYWRDLITLTRDLSGTGDNLENINPEMASGVAIQAIMDAKTLNVNMQLASYRQFAEDIAAIWLEMFRVYNPGGLAVPAGEGTKLVSPREIENPDLYIRIDASPTGATYRAAKDSRLRDLLEKGIITFREYVRALPKDSSMPVDTLRRIVRNRRERARTGMAE